MSRVSRACSAAGSAADPDTSNRARVSAAASPASASAASASRRYIVGTPNSIVASPLSAAPTAAGSNRPRCSARPPRRSGPRIPITSPCTWNSGSAWATTSRSVHSQISASASRLVAIARRGITAPLGGPVVPEV